MTCRILRCGTFSQTFERVQQRARLKVELPLLILETPPSIKQNYSKKPPSTALIHQHTMPKRHADSTQELSAEVCRNWRSTNPQTRGGSAEEGASDSERILFAGACIYFRPHHNRRKDKLVGVLTDMCLHVLIKDYFGTECHALQKVLQYCSNLEGSALPPPQIVCEQGTLSSRIL